MRWFCVFYTYFCWLREKLGLLSGEALVCLLFRSLGAFSVQILYKGFLGTFSTLGAYRCFGETLEPARAAINACPPGNFVAVVFIGLVGENFVVKVLCLTISLAGDFDFWKLVFLKGETYFYVKLAAGNCLKDRHTPIALSGDAWILVGDCEMSSALFARKGEKIFFELEFD